MRQTLSKLKGTKNSPEVSTKPAKSKGKSRR
jgi:hypothetical protein